MRRKQHKAITLFVIAFLFLGCKELTTNYNTDVKHDFAHYKFNRLTLTQTKSANHDFSSLYCDDNGTPFLGHCTSGSLFIINCETDSIERKYKLSSTIKAVHSISMSDSNRWAIYHDNSFTWNNGKINSIKTNSFDESIKPLSRHKIAYYAQEQQLIVVAIPKNLQPGQVPYDSDFLSVYDLDDKTHERIKFKFPKQYHNNRLGVPKVYISINENILSVSFGMDDLVYLIDLTTRENIGKYTLTSSFANHKKETEPVNNNTDLHEKKDNLLHNARYTSAYESAHFDINRNTLWRVFKPALPEKEGTYYMTSPDAGTHILRLNIKTGERMEYILPNGIYYFGEDWYLSGEQILPSLLYKKLEKRKKNEKKYSFSVHRITPYSF